MSTNKLSAYEVKVFDRKSETCQYCILEEAEQIDMPPIDPVNWTCHWKEFWKKTDFDCEAIIKCSYQGNMIGLIRFGLYPYDGNPEKQPEFLYVAHLQTSQEKTVTPVGQWLMWYTIKLGLDYCIGDNQSVILKLDSFEKSIPYYEDKIGMQGLGWITYAPGEELYAFMFTKENAKQFNERMEQRYGMPRFLR